MADQWPHTSAPTVTRVPVDTNHTFHLLATIFTCGLWAPVWVTVWAINASRRKILTAYGGQQTIVVQQPQQARPPIPPPPTGWA